MPLHTSFSRVLTNIFLAESSIYLEDCHNGIAEAYASDPDLAAKLWKLSESIVGQSFSLKVEPDANALYCESLK